MLRADVEDEIVHYLRTILLHPSTVLTKKCGILKYCILAPVLKINIAEKGYRLNGVRDILTALSRSWQEICFRKGNGKSKRQQC